MKEVADIIIDLWKYDISVFGQWWLYAPFLIPAMCYLSFFFLKWTVITAPLWLPIAILITIFRR